MYKFEYYPKQSGIIAKVRNYYHLLRIRMLKKWKYTTNEEVTDIASKTKELVIQIMYGGLGDHLVYSALPRLLWEQKGIKTFISNKSLYTNSGIRDFVWKNNPYIEFTDKKGWFNTAGKMDNDSAYDKYFQDLFKLAGSGAPEIFYKPIVIPFLKDKVILDISHGLAGIINGYQEPEYVERMKNYIKHNIPSFILILYKNKEINELQRMVLEEFKPEIYYVESLENVCDSLLSAHSRFVLYSGTASVSAGLNLESNVLCARKTNPNFQYSINSYINL